MIQSVASGGGGGFGFASVPLVAGWPHFSQDIASDDLCWLQSGHGTFCMAVSPQDINTTRHYTGSMLRMFLPPFFPEFPFAHQVATSGQYGKQCEDAADDRRGERQLTLCRQWMVCIFAPRPSEARESSF